MRKLEKVVSALVGDFSELPIYEQDLLKLAAKVRLNAQAPYSNYLVGVAILSDKGTTHMGCNVERASWTQTTHAEQNAVDNMVANLGPSKIKIVALIGGSANAEVVVPPKKVGKLITKIKDVPVPCGHCLQIIWENCFQDPDVKIIALASNGEVISTTMGDAFTMRFGPEHLGVDYSKTKRH